jgi:nicotinamide N-methyltransferase
MHMREIDPASLETGLILRDWNARDYLDYYYSQSSVPDDEAVICRFIARGLADIGRQFPAGLELGCGPVLHHAAQAIPWVDRLDMADYQDSNLEEIRRWLRKDPGAFDWSVYLAAAGGVLDAEHRRLGSLAEREAQMRARIQLLSCDLRDDLPLGKPVQYPLVTSYYCAEWVTPTIEGWRDTMRRVTSLVASGGHLFLAGVHATEYCVLNGRRVPCARVTSEAVRGLLGDLGFDRSTVRVELTPGQRPEVWGIQGTFLAYARRG